jgi:mRNA deadenylase 3'-5' endonuclease subunit Ccr4
MYSFLHATAAATTAECTVQVITRELFGYSADVVCLQECDKKVFDTVLQPVSFSRHS